MSISEFQEYILKLLNYLLAQISAFLGVRRVSTKEGRINATGLLDGHLLPKNKALEINMYTLLLLKTQRIFYG
jgi:hypothetical protein